MTLDFAAALAELADVMDQYGYAGRAHMVRADLVQYTGAGAGQHVDIACYVDGVPPHGWFYAPTFADALLLATEAMIATPGGAPVPPPVLIGEIPEP